MPIDLSHVNITIQQFQEISSGKYNAGEVRLTSDHSLGKINDHVHSRSKNVVPISQAEVLAVKDAFVKALQQNGVGADEINRVRRDLGLAPDGATDTSLMSRSIRPLTRQHVRAILDRNADTINQHAGPDTIRSHAQIFARYTEEQRAGFAQTRRETNLAMLETRRTIPDRRIQDAQSVLAGDVHFRSPETRQRLISAAEKQKAAILARSHGNPSDAPDATLRYQRNGGGPDITFSLGMSEKDYVRKLDDMIVLLRSPRQPGAATAAARDEFRRLDGPAAQAMWLAGLLNDPNGGFKARTIAVGLLLDAGVDDWETLSLVNRLSDFAAISLVSDLVNHAANLRGDALRQSPFVTALANQVEQQPIPAERQAFIPALSPDEANENALAALNNRTGCVSTQEAATIQAGVRRDLEERFGTDVFRVGAAFSTIASTGAVERAFAALGHPGAGVRLTAAQIQAAIVAEAAPDVVRTFLSKAIAPMLRAAGGSPVDAVGVASALFLRHPHIKERLLAAQSPEQARAVVNSHLPEIEAGIRRQLAVNRGREQAKTWYREEIAGAMGVPVSALEGRGVLNVMRLGTKSGALGFDICSGVNAANTDEEIAHSFRGLANVSAAVRINLMHQVDALNLPADARDILKHQILTLEKVTGFNMAALKQMADTIPVDKLLLALSSDAPADKVLAEMGAVGQRVEHAAKDVLADPGAGGDDIGAASNLLVTLALAKRPESFDLVRAFFARPDVAEINLVHLQGPASRAVAFQMFKPELPAAESNAELADAIGKPGLASLHAQALSLAMDDLGLGDLPAEEKAKILSDSAGNAIAHMVRTATKPVTPSQLRGIAQMALANEAAHHVANRYIRAFATDNNMGDAASSAGYVEEVVFKRNPGLRTALANALSGAAASGSDPAAAARAVLAAHNETIRTALLSFDAIRRVSATARETAAREIAEYTQLDEDFVRQKLDASGLLLETGGSLNFLRADIRDQLANPATDLANWNVANVEKQARDCVDSFIGKKSAFLAEMFRMPMVSDAARATLVSEALSYPPYKDYELAAAAGRVLRRPEIVHAFEYAKNTLTAEKVAALSDEDVFQVFEILGQHLNAAIEAELPAAKRAGMDNDDHAAIRSLLITAFADYCGQTLLGAAERLAADGRLDALDRAGSAARRRYDDDYMTYSGGINSKGQRVPVDLDRAAAANKGAAAVSLGQRLVSSLTDILHDEWLPAGLAEDIRLAKATHAQKALADAAIRHSTNLITRIGDGLSPEKFARFKAFAITLDYRNHALATTEELLRAAADALRAAEDIGQAEARLAELAGLTFRAQDAAATVAAAAKAAGFILNAAQTAKAVALLSEFGTGIPQKNARVLASFIVNLDLADRTADVDRRRVEAIAPTIAGWRDFGLVDPPAGKAEFAQFFKLEANALFADYFKPQHEARFQNDHFQAMVADIPRTTYIIDGKTFVTRPVAEVLSEFDRLVPSPKARRAISILMSQTSGPMLSQLQSQVPAPGNDLRPQPLDTTTLPGAGAFVSRNSMMPPELFFSPTLIINPNSAYKLTVSEDGTTATVTVFSIGKMFLGTDDTKMTTAFGSVVVEQTFTLDLTAENPIVTDVRVAQTFSDSTELNETDHLDAAEPFPPPVPVSLPPPEPPAVPPMPFSAPGPVPDIPLS